MIFVLVPDDGLFNLNSQGPKHKKAGPNKRTGFDAKLNTA
tara:strand:- start:13460 stop:13579 length:120 start_codon:yes stop_codon:yes gene_type:complete